MLCPQCGLDISPHHVTCPKCQFHVGFPNVRAAGEQREVDALEVRYQAARQHARQNACETALDQFETAVKQSKAVLCKRWGTLSKLTEVDNALFQTFYEQIDHGREPEDNEYDRARVAVDSTFFPYYYEQTHFAALSLNDAGLGGYAGPGGYGECTFVFRDVAISHRTTVFEENTVVFCQKVTIPVGQQPPAGFRAGWQDRHKLAAAKLHREITAQTDPNDFPGILMKQKGGTATDEFIEAHIYGKLPLENVELAVGRKPLNNADQVIMRRAERKLKLAGIQPKIV